MLFLLIGYELSQASLVKVLRHFRACLSQTSEHLFTLPTCCVLRLNRPVRMDYPRGYDTKRETAHAHEDRYHSRAGHATSV